MTLCFRTFLGGFGRISSNDVVSLVELLATDTELSVVGIVSSCTESSRAFNRLAIRAPSARPWIQPPYVKGGSYGAGEVRCHSLSTASIRAPCLCMSILAVAHEHRRMTVDVPGNNDNRRRFAYFPSRWPVHLAAVELSRWPFRRV